MGYTLNGKYRICKIPYTGVIAELGHIQGPVSKCRLTTAQIKRLISNGKRVYELNPKNLKEEVKLTLTNCETSPFEVSAKNTITTQEPEKTITVNVTNTGDEKVEEKPDEVQQNTTKNENHKNHNDFKKNKHNNDNKKNNSEVVTAVDIQ